MRKKIFKVTLVAILSVLLIGSAFLHKSNKGKKDSENYQDAVEEEDCISNIEEFVVGEWKQLTGNGEVQLIIELKSNNRFTYKVNRAEAAKENRAEVDRVNQAIAAKEDRVEVAEENSEIGNTENADTSLTQELQGVWEYDASKNSVKFVFDKLNEQLTNALEEDTINEDFGSIVDYDIEKKTIEVKVHYMGRDNFIGCEENRYFIDWFGIYLYKQ